MNQILYKKDTKGKTRFLHVHSFNGTLVQESGVVGTENPVVHSKECKGKNVGRSNETSSEQQAIREGDSLVTEKLKEGYFLTEAEAKTEEVIMPMLAKSFKDEVKKIEWPIFEQPKFDGMRALGDKEPISRKGTVIETVPHIAKVIPEIPFHLDGELYGHGIGFQENMRLTKKYRPGESEVIKYCIYDIVDPAGFQVRYGKFMDWWNSNNHDKTYGDVLYAVGYNLCLNKKELDKAHIRNIAEGYEGTMVRWGKEGYKPNGRSSNLLKHKDFLDLACEIIDIEPADQRPEWGVPVLKYKGKTFRAGMKYSHAEREEFLKNKKSYIGQIAEIRFFEYSEDGIPRFPVMVGLRNDKTKGD